METRKAFWRKIQRIFCSYSPLRMRSAFGKKSEHFFEKLSSHFTTEDLRAVWANKRKTFLKNFLFLLPTGDQLPVWPKTLEIFFPLLLFGVGRSVLTEDSGIISLHFPTDMRSAFGRKNRKLFRVFSVPIFHWSRDAHVVRFSGNFSSSLTWEKCQPPLFHYPLEEKRLFERKKDAVIQIFFSLIYLDRKRLVGRKNLKIEKKQPYHRKGSVIGLLSIEKFTIV